MPDTPLISALAWGRSQEAVKFIESGQYLDGVGDNGTTPLHLAASNRLPDAVRALINAKANVDRLNGHVPPVSPLLCAMTGRIRNQNKLDISRQLIAANADVNGKYPIIDDITKKIKWVYPREDMPHTLYFAVNPIQSDAPFDKLLISFLIESGADLDKECKFCNGIETSILAAARQNRIEAVGLLASYGANCKEVLTNFPNTPMAEAATRMLTFRYKVTQEALAPYLLPDLLENLLGYIEKPDPVISPKI
jgi:ankyrin repeat protein